MTELCQLAAKYGTDKVGVGYTAFYHLLLEHHRPYFTRVMEIGIGFPECMRHIPGYKPGASLRMWEEYFGLAQIFGLDCNPDALINEGRIQSRLCDQGKRSELIEAAQEFGPFDFILDDGSHASNHQIETAKMLLPFVVNGGFYIIEDVNHLEEVSQGLGGIPHTLVTFSAKPPGRLILIHKEAVAQPV